MSINDTSSDGGDSFFATQTGLLQDFDSFVTDSRDFIDQFYIHQKKQPATVASKLAFWSNRKLGSRLQRLLTSLSKREEYFDAHLRGMMDDSLTNVSSLSLQAVHLKWRLSSCIEYNKKEMEILGVQMGELQGLSFELSKGDKDTKDILHFVNEIIIQGESQLERNLNYFPIGSDVKEVFGFTSKDRSLVIKRLHMIRDVQSRTSKIFSEILELYKKHQGILRICQASYNLFCEIPADVVYDLTYEPSARGMHDTKPFDPRGSDSLNNIPSGDPSLLASEPLESDRKADHLMGALEKFFLQPDEKLNILLTKPNIHRSALSKKPLLVTDSSGSNSNSNSNSSSGHMKKGNLGNKKKGGCEIKEEIRTALATSICQPCTRVDEDPGEIAGSRSLDTLNSNNNSTAPSKGKNENHNGDRRPTPANMRCPHSNALQSSEDISEDSIWDRRECSENHQTGLGLDVFSVSTVNNFLKHIHSKQQIFTPSCFTEEEKQIEDAAYDHTQCCDCSVVDDLARDCITRLSVMHRKAAESFGRLEKLLEIREDLININMSIKAQKSF